MTFRDTTEDPLDAQNFLWATGLGAVTIGILLWLGITAPATGCDNATLSPVMAFQAARSSTDLTDIFGSGASSCRITIVKGLAFGSQLDLFLFIPVYAFFLGLIVRALQRRPTKMTWVLYATLIVTVIGDLVETTAQLQILEDVSAGSDLLSILMLGNSLKVFGLSMFLFGAAWALWSQRKWIARAAAIALSALAIARISGYLVDNIEALAPLSALGAFVVLWMYAGSQYINARRHVLK